MQEAIRITPEILDELVAGSLPRERYRSILRSLDKQPQRWRDCALAFLEEQAVTEDLQALAAENVDWNSNDGNHTKSSVALEHNSPLLTTQPPSAQIARSSASHSASTAVGPATRHLLWMQRLTSLAALLLISFSVGWIGSGLKQQWFASSRHDSVERSLPTQNAASHKRASPSTTHQAAATQNAALASTPGSTTMQHASGAPLGGSGWEGAIKLTGDYLPVDRALPPQLAELQARGLVRIEYHEGFFPVELDDGTSALMPVQRFEVVPKLMTY